MSQGKFAVVAAIASSVLFGRPALGADVPPRPSAGCKADTIERGRKLERTIDIAGTPRSYVLDVPDRVRPGVPAPLLFDFHGFGHSGKGVWEVSGFRALAEREGFITVYPEGLPVRLTLRGVEQEAPGWALSAVDPNRDLLFTGRLLDDLERRYCIDRARIYATGFSNGAFFSQVLGCVFAHRFAAVAPVSGGLVGLKCDPTRGVPILIQHGRLDDLIPAKQAHAARDKWVAANQCRQSAHDGCERHTDCRDGAVVEYCEENYAHRWPPQATERIWKFFSQHPMPAPAGGSEEQVSR